MIDLFPYTSFCFCHLITSSSSPPLIPSPPHLLTPSSPHLLTSTSSPPHPLIPSSPHLLTPSSPHPLTPSPPHLLTPSPLTFPLQLMLTLRSESSFKSFLDHVQARPSSQGMFLEELLVTPLKRVGSACQWGRG